MRSVGAPAHTMAFPLPGRLLNTCIIIRTSDRRRCSLRIITSWTSWRKIMYGWKFQCQRERGGRQNYFHAHAQAGRKRAQFCIHVARFAGMLNKVVLRANDILHFLEKTSIKMSRNREYRKYQRLLTRWTCLNWSEIKSRSRFAFADRH